MERLRFEIGWNWNKERHKVAVCGIMLGASIIGSLLLGSSVHEALGFAHRR